MLLEGNTRIRFQSKANSMTVTTHLQRYNYVSIVLCQSSMQFQSTASKMSPPPSFRLSLRLWLRIWWLLRGFSGFSNVHRTNDIAQHV
jgi:hypothetical protein